MNSMKQKLFTNWHLMRIVRLGIGVWLLIAGIQMKDWVTGLLSIFFLYQAVTDTGCCGAQGCYARSAKGGRKDEIHEVDYEEIK